MNRTPLIRTSCTPGHRRWLAYAMLALSMSLTGAYVALSKPLVAALPVFLLAWLRFGLAALAMPHWLNKPGHEKPLGLRAHSLLFIESFIGNFLFSICMLYGLSMSSAVSAGVIMASLPVAVALMSWLILGERTAPRVWTAITCAGLSMLLLTLSTAEHSTQQIQELETGVTFNRELLGQALVFAAVLCEAAYAVLSKKLIGVLAPTRITAIINLWGFVLMTPWGLYAAWHFDFGTVNVGLWWLLLFYALAASIIVVWLWMTGLKTVPAAQAGVFCVLLPVSAALVGVGVLGESILPLQWLAFACATGAVLLATWR